MAGCLDRVGVLVFAACTQMIQPAFAARQPKAYVGNFKDNTVSVIDTEAGKVVATVPVAARAARHGDNAGRSHRLRKRRRLFVG